MGASEGLSQHLSLRRRANEDWPAGWLVQSPGATLSLAVRSYLGNAMCHGEAPEGRLQPFCEHKMRLLIE